MISRQLHGASDSVASWEAGIAMTGPNMWDTVHKWCSKWMTAVGGIIVILGAMFAGVNYIVRSELAASGLGNRIERLEETIKPLPDAISSLRDRITKMETHWEDLAIKTLSQQPPSKQSSQAIKEALSTAQIANLKLSPDVIQEVGRKFIAAASRDPIAWDAALAILDYRTFLNSENTVATETPADTHYLFQLNLRPNPDIPTARVMVSVKVTQAGGQALPEDSARIETLKKPNASGSGVRYLIVDGGADIVVLDGEYLKNVVIRNAVVEYDGGPVRLDNVYFLNCTVRFRLTSPARSLGTKMLASASVSFKQRG